MSCKLQQQQAPTGGTYDAAATGTCPQMANIFFSGSSKSRIVEYQKNSFDSKIYKIKGVLSACPRVKMETLARKKNVGRLFLVILLDISRVANIKVFVG